MTTAGQGRAQALQPGQDPASEHRPRTRFRPDIQGLRALAVTIVVLDHAGVPGLGGGYVGVDVFFVISGYLITQLLMTEATTTGRVSLARFYSRRARRILPAATVVLVFTAVSSVALLGYVRATSVLKDEVWAAFFAANLRFGREHSDYFEADTPPSPVQHFWSLAVEEQFYLVWPLVLLLLVLLLHGARRQTWVVGTVIVLAVAISLVWCIVITARDPQGAYFSTTARAWELALGAACALFVTAVSRWPAALSTVVGWSGLALIAIATITFSARTPFPGFLALVPTVGAALVILGGEGRARHGPSVALALPWSRRVGDWSYSIYLWHWPILVLAAAAAGHELGVGQNLGLVGIVVVLSALTYALVENPVRRSPVLAARARRGLLVYPLALSVTLLAIGAGNRMVQKEIAAVANAPAIDLTPDGAEPRKVSADPAIATVQLSVDAARSGQRVPGHLRPSLLDLHDDLADVGECDYSLRVRTLCERGSVGSHRRAVVLGDSHARAWIPAFDVIFERHGLSAYYLVKPGCTAAMIVPDTGSGPFEGCVEWRAWAIETIHRLRPELVVIAGGLPEAYIDSDRGSVDDPAEVAAAVGVGTVDTIRQVRGQGRRVIVIGDVPGVSVTPDECLSQRGADLGDCVFPRAAPNEALVRAQRHAARATGSDFVDPLRWFCSEGLCPSVIGSFIPYRDTEHITPEYAIRLAGSLQTAMGLGG